MSTKDQMFKALAIGGLIGVSSYYLFNTKQGARLRKDLRRFTQELSDKASEMAEEAEDLKEELMDRGHEFYNNTRKSLLNGKSHSPELSSSTIAKGALAATVLGAVAVFLLSREDKSHDFIKQTSRYAKGLTDKARNIIDELDEARERGEEIASSGSSALNDVIQLATLGLKLYQTVKKGR